MTDRFATDSVIDSSNSGGDQYIAPSFQNALPYYLPLAVFPLLFLALYYGSWWLIGPFAFMSLAGLLDRPFGPDGINLNPRGTSDSKFVWYNLPVWTWACLWPPTLIFGMWQILVGGAFALWESLILVILLTMEAQAVFVVGHELVHRRSIWERRLGEFLLASNSYPQYATEHVYVHHAQVGTPHDVGSAPKGESFWKYFPREVVCNLTNSWDVVSKRLARRNHSRWHYSNPFWRYAAFVLFWYGIVYALGGVWALPVYLFLGLGCVFSMKISNYFQHYGLRRVKLDNGRWEKASSRHSWDADWRFTNWMFFKMQRHADHHAVASRPYPQLQHLSGESPELPGTYGDMMNLVLRPKKWFEKMDPLVDQWRKEFYPEIDDWSPYDSSISAVRPNDFDAIVEIFGVAPRLAKWVERFPELLDNLSEREFTDLDLPKGIMEDQEYDIARRGLARLYWTLEMSVKEIQNRIADIPSTNAKETAEFACNWVNDKAFQVGMHVLRDNLSLAESQTALSNLAEASISAVIADVISDFMEPLEASQEGSIAIVLLGDLASREACPGVEIELYLVYEDWPKNAITRLERSVRTNLAHFAKDSLLFSSFSKLSEQISLVEIAELQKQVEDFSPNSNITWLTQARLVLEYGSSSLKTRFNQLQKETLDHIVGNETYVVAWRRQLIQSSEPKQSNVLDVDGKIDELRAVARYYQLTNRGVAFDGSELSALSMLERSNANSLAEALNFWQNLRSITRLILGKQIDLSNERTKVQKLVATACGYEDLEALNAAKENIEARTAEVVDLIIERE